MGELNTNEIEALKNGFVDVDKAILNLEENVCILLFAKNSTQLPKISK